MNTLLNYPGAKWGMAKEIVALMPPHRSYLEPFFGSGAVLLQHKGPVILSGYPSELYDRELKNWHRITRNSYNQNSDPRTEVLWCNFELPSLFDMEVV